MSSAPLPVWFALAAAILAGCVFVVSAACYIGAAGKLAAIVRKENPTGYSVFPASDKSWPGNVIGATVLRRLVLGLTALEFPDDRYTALLHRARVNIAICAMSWMAIFISLGFLFTSDWFAAAFG